MNSAQRASLSRSARTVARVAGAALLTLALGAAEDGDAGTWAPPEVAILRAFATKDYAAADAACRDQLTRQPSNVEATYGLACALAREGKVDEAFAQLDAATTDGFCDAKRAEADDDLASLHARAAFAKSLARMRAVPIGTGCPVEQGADIEGLTTIERQPKGGLHFRLRVKADATRAKPERLVIWMHPSGGSMDDRIEQHAQELVAHGYALCVFPHKQYIGWSDQEAEAITPTVADIASVPGVDARKPILMGFSAGAQQALKMFVHAPTSWGGLILDAAYPVVITNQATGQASLLVPAAAAGATHLPILVLVGGDDANAAIWDKAVPAWNQAGLHPSVRVIPGRKHEYLFAGDAWTATLAFLDGITGSKPH